MSFFTDYFGIMSLSTIKTSSLTRTLTPLPQTWRPPLADRRPASLTCRSGWSATGRDCRHGCVPDCSSRRSTATGSGGRDLEDTRRRQSTDFRSDLLTHDEGGTHRLCAPGPGDTGSRVSGGSRAAIEGPGRRARRPRMDSLGSAERWLWETR